MDENKISLLKKGEIICRLKQVHTNMKMVLLLW